MCGYKIFNLQFALIIIKADLNFGQLKSVRKQKMRDSLEKNKHTQAGKTVIGVQGFPATFRANAFVPRLGRGVGGWMMEMGWGCPALHTLLSGACARPRQRNR